MSKPGVGVVIGRFQVPELHEGHRRLIGQAAQHQRLIVFLGIHPALTSRRDPLDFATRERMIKSAFPQALVSPLQDQPTDEGWSESLDRLIRTYHPMGEITLYSGPDSFAPRYHGRNRVIVLDEVPVGRGTEIREGMAQIVEGSPDFRKGVIYAAYNSRPHCYPCADIALLKDTDPEGKKASVELKYEVLLVSRPTTPDVWRFPGGFTDVEDESIESTARREIREETGLGIEGEVYYIGSFRIEDWRDTPTDRIFSNFYTGLYTFGAARAGDDIAGGQVKWVPVVHVRRNINQVSEDHKVLVEALWQWILRNGRMLGQEYASQRALEASRERAADFFRNMGGKHDGEPQSVGAASSGDTDSGAATQSVE